jgi:hypothetical protein
LTVFSLVQSLAIINLPERESMSVSEDNHAAKAEVCRSSAAFLRENIDDVVSLGVSAEGYPTRVDNFTNLEAGTDIRDVNPDQASFLILRFFLHFLSWQKSMSFILGLSRKRRKLLEFGLHLGRCYLTIWEAQISYRKSRVVYRDDMRDFSLTLLIYVEPYQLISEVYVKVLHERTKDMRAAMCICITHTRTRARFAFYALLSCDLL